jgi:hypothetical protein
VNAGSPLYSTPKAGWPEMRVTAVSAENSLELTGVKNADVLLFDLP